jgi:hypothetical protein
MNNKEEISIKSIRGYSFSKPIVLKRTVKDGLIILKNDDYNIRVCGHGDEELQQNLEEEIDFLKQNYIDEKEENLSTDAVALKKRLEELFGSF